MAKAAVHRQINGTTHQQKEVVPESDPLEFPPKDEVVIPEPKRSWNGNGNGNGKPHLKDPGAPATKKQKNLIIRLAKERGQFIDNLNGLTMREASETIEELMSVTV